MMTFSVIWVLLAATVSVLAIMRRAGANNVQSDVQVRQSGRALMAAAILYSLVLIAGFLYIGWQTALR